MKKRRKQKIWSVTIVISYVILTSWLFFDFSPASAFLISYVPFALKRQNRELERQNKWRLNLSFKDALICMENSLAVGYSPESSVKESLKSLEQLYGKDHEICREFRKMIKQMDLGAGMEEVFLEFGKRSDIGDIKQMADIFAIVKRTGGNLSQVLRQTGNVLQDKIDLKRELHTVIAAKKTEFHMMCAVPYGILLYLKFCAPALSSSLYHNTFGILFMSAAWGAILGLKLLGEHMICGEIGRPEG